MNNFDLDTERHNTQTMLDQAEVIFDRATCDLALDNIATQITDVLADQYPLVLSVMGGAVVFTGKLLPLLRFPLDFDYIHISRYGDKLRGGNYQWLRAPKNDVAGRHVLVLDDILDEGHTMAAVKKQILDLGALSCSTAVFANKLIDQPKPVIADFVGLDVPNRYVFGYGMDVAGKWRNLDEIYALTD
ncbi:hypoxanthine-guanine phosphoribosyltransferase [Neisseriaceae bacterium ESL0693]|nr:hypoxanthine-guanine phosphoribosyltransferase [Neisseriaceae bacterium ESL0693]